jgi:hypothetical protein
MKLLITGHGECGKDTAAELLSEELGIKNGMSISKAMSVQVAERLGVDPETAYEQRRDNRILWMEVINGFRFSDPTKPLREAFRYGDIVSGARMKCEVDDRTEGLFDFLIWVDRKSVPVDPTLELLTEDCDFVLNNNGTLEQLKEQVEKLAYKLTAAQSKKYHAIKG